MDDVTAIGPVFGEHLVDDGAGGLEGRNSEVTVRVFVLLGGGVSDARSVYNQISICVWIGG